MTMWVRAIILASGLGLAALCAPGAAAAPVASAPGLTAESGAEPANWHRRRCWWETRRFRDHRGRWQTRRVQVCRRW
jgi:hypothetical protein